MSKCPECGEEIDHLVNVESGDMDYRFNPDGSYEAGEFLSDGGRNEYECPECQATLFSDETTALEFLQRKEQEIEEAPITIYWRKEKDEKLYSEGMRDFDAAERKRDELIKAGRIDIQIIVKGKKKEVVK